MKKLSLLKLPMMVLALSSILMTSCSDDNDSVPAPTPNIAQIVIQDPNFSTLEAAVVKAGLADALATTQDITVFAPDNAAFAAAGITPDVINSLTADEVEAILAYHVLGQRVSSSAVPVSDAVATLNGENLYASRNTNGVFVNGIKVKQADVLASNGIIHVIEGVLLPPTENIAEIVTRDPSFSFLLEALQKTGLAATFTQPGKYTVFAPTNDAFRAAGIDDINAVPVDVLTAVLKYHVIGTNVFASDLVNGATAQTLQGGTVTVNATPAANVKISSSANPASGITTANIVATNGVIHVINRAMLP
jgi:uncharacterized surface protein with fasciclin (FAS1) repeats